MTLQKVPLWGNLQKHCTVNPKATEGAVIGRNVWNQDGTLFVPEPADSEDGNDLAVTIWRYILEIPPNVVALEKAVGTGLFAVTGPSTGAFRTLQLGSGLTGSNLDGVAGDPAFDHADTSSVADIAASFTGGTVPDQIGLTFDQFGHVLTRTITGRTLDHNDTGTLQGGNATERYHFTEAEHSGLQPWASEDPDDYALITQSITNSDTTHSPSGDAVFDALAFSGALVTISSNQTIASSSSTFVPFGTVTYDTDGYHSAGAPTRLTAHEDGVYIVSGSIRWDNDSTGYRRGQFFKNGASFPGRNADTQNAVSGNNSLLNCSTPALFLLAGDYFEFEVTQDSGSDRTIPTNDSVWFAIRKIAAW